jgi:hypothetical protein
MPKNYFRKISRRHNGERPICINRPAAQRLQIPATVIQSSQSIFMPRFKQPRC